MRRSTGIVIGACVAAALIGSVSAAAWTYTTEGRTVGSWHEAPGAAGAPAADLGAKPPPEMATGR